MANKSFTQIYKKLLLRAAILLAFFTFSCSDSGCIDADDFGEFETETLEVKANVADDSCFYDPTKPVDSIDQGSSVKACLTNGSKSVVDANDHQYSSSTSNGCAGLQQYGNNIVQICAYDCASRCSLAPTNADGSAVQSEPGWTSTHKRATNRNYGVSIRPDSQVMVRAVGNISLGDTAVYDDIYVAAKNVMPDASKLSSWDDKVYFNVRKGNGLNIQFSGKWSENISATTVAYKGTFSDDISALSTFNAAKRLVGYLIPNPPGFSYKKESTYENSFKGSLPLPDSRVWKCSYSNTESGEDSRQSTCINESCDKNPYSNLGYTSANCQQTHDNFPISSADDSLRENYLGYFGGMIRWNNDGLSGFEDDPFAGVSCSPNCSDIPSSLSDRGKFIDQDITTETEIYTNLAESVNSYKVSFKSFNNACSNVPLIVYIKKNSDILYKFETGAPSGNSIPTFSSVTVTNSSWSQKYISLEPGQTISVKSPTNGSCGNSILMRLDKFHDIKIRKSGFVSFKTLNNSTANGCIIKARIVNKCNSATDTNCGSHVGVDNSYTADFYEYDNFESTISGADLGDPLANLAVSSNSWSNKVFVRKNQVIRFAPESWNTPGSSTRECGIGMAMKIEPRPAVLCKGVGSELVVNPTCVRDFTDSSGAAKGCKETKESCLDKNCKFNDGGTDVSCYCPDSSCRAAFDSKTCPMNSSPTIPSGATQKNCPSFTNAQLVANFTTTTERTCSQNTTYLKNCPANATTETICPDLLRNGQRVMDTPAVNEAACSACSKKLISQANLQDKLLLPGADLCYDLENYHGKASNITGSLDLNSSANANKIKGLTKLRPFKADGNGDYGNFEEFSDSGKTTDPNHGGFDYKLINSKQSLTPSASGRLLFFIADGSDFRTLENEYSNNSDLGTSYDKTNGMEIKTTGLLEFQNGQWLQAKLCQATSADSDGNCRVSNITALENQPSIIDITKTSTFSLVPNLGSSNYAFDDYGTLNRATDVGVAGDCSKESKTSIRTIKDSAFYCHTSGFSNGVIDDAQVAKLRLSFKVFDPEIANCVKKTAAPTSVASESCTNPSGPLTAGVVYCNGVKRENANYNSNTPGNTGALCQTLDISTCSAQYICSDLYSNNSGKYNVSIKVKTPASAKVSGIIADVVNPVVTVMDGTYDAEKGKRVGGQAERMYKALIGDSRYKAILTMSLVLMFSFYGFTYLIGISELNHAELVGKIMKIGLIYFFTSEFGWEWFNNIVVSFFKDGTDYLAFTMASAFDSSQELGEAIKNDNFVDKSVLFASADKVFNMFFSQAVQKKISALLFASLFGWVYLIIIYNSFLLYLYAVANAVLLYLTSQVFISLLFTLGPIFFIFTLFNHTKDMFDNWLKQLISFSLQQIFLLTTLAFFNMMMYEVIKLSLGYKICWDDVWTINLITRVTLLSFWTIASLPPRINAQSDVGNIGNPDGIPSLFSILFIWVIASLMNKFVGFMTDIAASIGGGISASELGSGIKQAAAGLKNTASKYAGKAWDSTGGQALRKADKFLFDSGKLAEQEREKLKAQDSADSKNKKELLKAGDSAISKFKKEHGGELAGLSDEAKNQKLQGIAKEGRTAAARKLGISADEQNRLESMSGTKHRGHGLAGLALAKLKNETVGPGSKSIEDRQLNKKFSRSEFEGAYKSATDDQRKDLLKDARSGKMDVDKSKKAKIADAVRTSPLGKQTGRVLDSLKQGKADVSSAKGFAGKAKALAKAAANTVTQATVGTALHVTKDTLAMAAKPLLSKVKASRAMSKAINKAYQDGEANGLFEKGVPNFARKSEEKRMARSIATKSLEQQAFKLAKPDQRTIKDLERNSEVVAGRENPDESATHRSAKSIRGKLTGRGKNLALKDAVSYPLRDSSTLKEKNAAGAPLKTQEAIKEARSTELGAAKVQVEGALKETQIGKRYSVPAASAKEVKESSDAKKKILADNQDFKDLRQTFKDAQKTAKDNPQDPNARKDLVTAHREFTEHPAYAQYQEASKEHNLNKLQAGTQRESLEARKANIEAQASED